MQSIYPAFYLIMRQHKYAIVIILLFFRFISVSQTISTKFIVDSKTKLPIEFVNIYPESKKINLLSDRFGSFKINADLDTKIYIVNKTGYYIKSFSKADLLKLDTVFLVEKPFDLSEITIISKKLEECVKDKRFYVQDYLVLPNYDFLIITYKINIEGFEVSYYKKDHGVTCTKKFKTEYNQHLFKDCFSNYHLVTNACSRQFYFISDTSFDFLPAYRKTYFDSTLSRIVLRIDSQVIYRFERPSLTYKGTYFKTDFHSPFMTYVSVYNNKKTDLYTAVYSKEMRDMIQSEISDSQRNNEYTTTVGSRANSVQSTEASNSFFIETIVGPIYSPIFLRNDTLIILNFQEDNIVFLSRNGIILKTVKMDGISKYHQIQAYYDEIANRFYVTQTENDRHMIKRLNVYTGKFERTIGLERPFPKNIQIVNNRMYFQVKEHEWDDTSYIYLQNL